MAKQDIYLVGRTECPADGHIQTLIPVEVAHRERVAADIVRDGRAYGGLKCSISISQKNLDAVAALSIAGERDNVEPVIAVKIPGSDLYSSPTGCVGRGRLECPVAVA